MVLRDALTNAIEDAGLGFAVSSRQLF